MKFSLSWLAAFFVLAASSISGNACSRIFSFEMAELFSANLIVRATAVQYIVTPNPDTTTTGVPDSTVEFRIEETIWGVPGPPTITLRAYLSETDDFNEYAPPYRFVRKGGRSGSCFANSYKKGAQFLLFLKRVGNGYTTNISALGPTNEQLKGPDDPWVHWVKAYLSPCAKQHPAGADYAFSPKGELLDLLIKEAPGLEQYRIAKCYLARYGADGGDAAQFRIIESYESPPQRR
jgi:hypothetical protein